MSNYVNSLQLFHYLEFHNSFEVFNSKLNGSVEILESLEFLNFLPSLEFHDSFIGDNFNLDGCLEFLDFP